MGFETQDVERKVLAIMKLLSESKEALGARIIARHLKGQGIEEIQCLGKKFDPNFQEVVEEVEAKDKEPQTVVEEIKKGYTLYGQVLRPAKVRVIK